jgi:CheY-like chemotaxis protein
MDTAKKKILIVDDEADMLETMAFILSKAGYDIIKASRGKDAIALAQSEHPDLILLDIKMPEMDGVNTSDILRSHQSTGAIPIAYLSSLVSEKQVKDGHVLGSKIGDLYFIPKTYSAEKIVELVKLSMGERG